MYDDPDAGPDSESDEPAPRGTGATKGKGKEGAVYGSMQGGDEDLSDEVRSDVGGGFGKQSKDEDALINLSERTKEKYF